MRVAHTNSLIEKRTFQFICFAGIFVTFVVTPFTNFDPINLGKAMCLALASFGVLGLAISNVDIFLDKIPRSILIVVGLFVSWMILSSVFSEAPIQQQLWGVWGRNTGILSYISLSLILLASSSLTEKYLIKKLLLVLIWTSIAQTAYMIIQTFGLDPIKWSRKEAFGTLGNINFSSSFLGICSSVLVSYLLFAPRNLAIKTLVVVSIFANVVLTWRTGSIQGPGILAISTSLILGIWLWFKRKKFILLAYIIAISIAGSIGFLGLLNRGPLAKVLFQETLVYRWDYWTAGFNMTLLRPLFGLGMDSYGDWYRAERTIEATIRTGPDRISNSAHNIFLDISSGGGIPLLVLYLTIIFLSLRSGISFLKVLGTSKDLQFQSWQHIGILGALIAYLAQCLISINQIGVGVWGWVLTGLLIASSKQIENEDKFSDKSHNAKAKTAKAGRKSSNEQLLPAKSALAVISGMAIGVFLTWFPLNADMKFRSAQNSRDIKQMVASLDSTGITAFHYENVIQSAIQANLSEVVKDLNPRLTRTYPRDFYGWLVMSRLTAISDKDRNFAIAKLRLLDPHNPQIPNG